MNEDRWEAALEELLDAHIRALPTAPLNLDNSQQTEAEALTALADLLWEEAHGAPPVKDDPVAAMLGLVPDSSRALDGKALRNALRAAGMNVSELARKLSDRGWEVATRDVFSWQARDSTTVPPALIQAIADVIGRDPDRLTIDRGQSQSQRAFEAVAATARFRELAERWARLRRTSADLAAAALEARLAASVFRGTRPDTDQMLASLEALVTALEQREPGESHD